MTEHGGEMPKVEKVKGFGYAYLRGRTWWIRYYHNGQDFRESVKSGRLLDAERLLKARWKQIGQSKGRFIGPKEEKVRVNDLLDGVITDYQTNGRRSLCSLLGRLRPLRDYFGSMRAADATGAMIEKYKATRLATKTARGKTPLKVATVNRELAALNRAYRLAIKQDRITHAPIITLMAENNARQGFVEPATFEKIVRYLPDPLDDLARFAYITGWRRGEITTLEWSDVNLDARRVWLRSEHSKNREPRILVLTGELLKIIQRRWGAAGVPNRFRHSQSEPVGVPPPRREGQRFSRCLALSLPRGGRPRSPLP